MKRELHTAKQLGEAAAAAVMQHYGAALAHNDPGESPVTAADIASNRVIVEGLRSAFPDDAILSEETADSADRLTADRLWIVDPLDGTREFIAGIPEFAVMIGLAVRGEPVLGVVNVPAAGVVYVAVAGEGAWAESAGGERRRLRCVPADPKALRLVGSRSHADPLVTKLAEGLGIADVAPSGSAGVKCAAIAEGRRDVYVHPVPYLKEWDTCAPEVLLREAGGEVTDCRGDRLRYNKSDPHQPDGIVACGPGALETVLSQLGPLYEAARSASHPAR